MDGHGNHNMGISDHTIFPEINIDRERKLVGMDITFVKSTNDDKQGYALLSKFGMPFRKKSSSSEGVLTYDEKICNC
jgi:large subunit ribosomal protein L5